MRLAVFTANQPRHVALVHALQDAGHEVLGVFVEPKPRLTGAYGRAVAWAEIDVFGAPDFCDVPITVLFPGEISTSAQAEFAAYHAERAIVFSASYIKPPLLDVLLGTALNLHVGIAPAYRGSACNFWAEYDGHPELVGAQVQRLSAGLDVGEILAEARPPLGGDPFRRGMEAVRLGIEALVQQLAHPTEPIAPTTAPIRVARHADFTEAVMTEYLSRVGSPSPA